MSSMQTWIEREGTRLAYFETSKVRVAGIEQVIELALDDDARYPQYNGA